MTLMTHDTKFKTEKSYNNNQINILEFVHGFIK